jgi:hypothetical protein
MGAGATGVGEDDTGAAGAALVVGSGGFFSHATSVAPASAKQSQINLEL